MRVRMVVPNIIHLLVLMYAKRQKPIIVIFALQFLRLMDVRNGGMTVRLNAKQPTPITVVTGLLLLANMPALLISEIANLSVKVVLQIIVQIERQSVFQVTHIVLLTSLTVLLSVQVGYVTLAIQNQEMVV